jgi:hypothetical protein
MVTAIMAKRVTTTLGEEMAIIMRATMAATITTM